MFYYHGSPNLFDNFDLNKSKSQLKVVHFTPHISYAKMFAVKDFESGYLYTVEIKGQEDLKYGIFMQNIMVQDLSIVNIVRVDAVMRVDDEIVYL